MGPLYVCLSLCVYVHAYIQEYVHVHEYLVYSMYVFSIVCMCLVSVFRSDVCTLCMCSCDQVQPDVNDLLSYAHFLNVVLNYSLSQGNIPGALRYGESTHFISHNTSSTVMLSTPALLVGRAAISISNKLHEVPIKLASMTLLSQALLASEL